MSGSTVVAAISTHAYDYDSLGRRTKQTLQDDSRWEYGYNDRSEVTSATRKTAAGTEVAPLAAGYSYDGIGNRLTSTSPVLGDHGYTPNELNQYETITTGDSRTAVGRAPAAWNVQVEGVNAGRIGELYHRGLTASNATAPVWQSVVTRRDTGTPTMTNHFWYAKQSIQPTYDEDGNLTNDGRWSYSWNAENRLIQMETTTQATAAGHPYTKLTFVYDWQGRRLARHVWQGETQATAVFKSSTRWLYDGWNPITEFTADSDNSTTRLNTYTWGLDLSGSLQGAGGVGGLLAINHQPSTINSSPSYDGNGNIVAWTKSTDSAPTSRREYDAFGNTLVSEGIAPCGFGFSTKIQDGETSLYYYGYRYFDPVTGRWLSRDPIGESGGLNYKAFCANNPIDAYDVLGLKTPIPASFIKGRLAAMKAKALASRVARESNFNEMVIRLSGYVDYVEYFHDPTASRAEYSGFWEQIRFKDFPPEDSIILHELVHVYNEIGVAGLKVDSDFDDEGMAHAVQYQYESMLNLMDMENDLKASKSVGCGRIREIMSNWSGAVIPDTDIAEWPTEYLSGFTRVGGFVTPHHINRVRDKLGYKLAMEEWRDFFNANADCRRCCITVSLEANVPLRVKLSDGSMLIYAHQAHAVSSVIRARDN